MPQHCRKLNRLQLLNGYWLQCIKSRKFSFFMKFFYSQSTVETAKSYNTLKYENEGNVIKTHAMFIDAREKIIDAICEICFTNVLRNQSKLGMTHLIQRVNTKPLSVCNNGQEFQTMIQE